jgi:hypothetical protein
MDLSAPAGGRVVDDDPDLLEPRTGLPTASVSAVSAAAFVRTVPAEGVLFNPRAEAT